MIVKTQLNVKAVEGDHIILQFSVVDEDGNPVILTGKTIKWAARNSITKTNVLNKETGDGITILDAPDDDKFEVVLDSADTADLKGNYDHEAVIIDGVEKVSIKNGDNSFGIITFREKVV